MTQAPAINWEEPMVDRDDVHRRVNQLMCLWSVMAEHRYELTTTAAADDEGCTLETLLKDQEWDVLVHSDRWQKVFDPEIREACAMAVYKDYMRRFDVLAQAMTELAAKIETPAAQVIGLVEIDEEEYWKVKVPGWTWRGGE